MTSTMQKDKIKISSDMLEKLNVLEDAVIREKIWSEEDDAIIKEFYPLKNKEELAKLLGVSYKTLLKRYRELTDE